MMYAMARDGERDIPAKQWTNTHSLASRTLSIRDNRQINVSACTYLCIWK